MLRGPDGARQGEEGNEEGTCEEGRGETGSEEGTCEEACGKEEEMNALKEGSGPIRNGTNFKDLNPFPDIILDETRKC